MQISEESSDFTRKSERDFRMHPWLGRRGPWGTQGLVASLPPDVLFITISYSHLKVNFDENMWNSNTINIVFDWKKSLQPLQASWESWSLSFKTKTKNWWGWEGPKISFRFSRKIWTFLRNLQFLVKFLILLRKSSRDFRMHPWLVLGLPVVLGLAVWSDVQTMNIWPSRHITLLQSGLPNGALVNLGNIFSHWNPFGRWFEKITPQPPSEYSEWISKWIILQAETYSNLAEKWE